MKKQKILIVDSIILDNSIPQPQIGPLIIRNILSNEYDVEIVSFSKLIRDKCICIQDTIDMNVHLFSDYILKMIPDVVCFYTMCDSFYISATMSQTIKQKCPTVKIVMSGPHATLIAREILEDFTWVDIVAMGEGETTAHNIIDVLVQDADFSDVLGVAYRKQGEIILNELAPPVLEDSLSLYTPFDFEPYEIDKSAAIYLEGGRGCPFACTFCSTSTFWGRNFRVKKSEDILREMECYNAKYGAICFSIQHDLFTARRSYVFDFCNKFIAKGNGYSWGCSSRIDVLDEELIDLLAAANCTSMFLGIETGSPRMQKIINKNLNLDRAYEIISYLNLKKIRTKLSFIYCLPDETLADFELTAQMIEWCIIRGISNISLHLFMLLPNTQATLKVYDKAEFNPNSINRTIFAPGQYTEESFRFVRKYKREFIQFYSADSLVQETFPYFDIWVMVLVDAMCVYRSSIKTLLEKCGIIKLYIDHQDAIIELVSIQYKLSLAGDTGLWIATCCRTISRIIHAHREQVFDDIASKVFEFEESIFSHMYDDIQPSRLYRFDFDVMHYKNTGEYLEKETYYKVEHRKKSNVHISRVTIKSKV